MIHQNGDTEIKTVKTPQRGKRRKRKKKRYIRAIVLLSVATLLVLGLIISAVVLIVKTAKKPSSDPSSGQEQTEQGEKTGDKVSLEGSKYVPNKDPSHDYDKYYVSPTCEMFGFTFSKCASCTKNYIDIKIPYGHRYGAWQSVDGRVCRICLSCGETDYYSSDKSEFRLQVENVVQDESLPNGCEIVSLTTVLKYLGFDVTPEEIIEKYLPMAGIHDDKADPFESNIGDPRDEIAYGCYAPCLVKTANAFLKEKGSSLRAYDVSGQGMDTAQNYIKSGVPVIVWGALYMDGVGRPIKWFVKDGEMVSWLSHSHCVVAIGYNERQFVCADPLAGIVRYKKSAVEECNDLVYRQMVIIK